MRAKTEDIKIQSEFCKDLAIRLNEDIQKAENACMSNRTGVKGHSRIQADITRLRIELNDLRKMMDWGYMY